LFAKEIILKKEIFQKFTIPITPHVPTLHRTEVWVDNALVAVYTGQDALNVELGKIPVPKGATLKIMDY
jgi:hypothetical protein